MESGSGSNKSQENRVFHTRIIIIDLTSQGLQFPGTVGIRFHFVCVGVCVRMCVYLTNEHSLQVS